MTAKTALDSYNNATYNYRNEAVGDWPMEMAQHDPSNVRTLDVSGNGYNATFGDGTTSNTIPTKTQERGYDNIATSYLNLGDVAALETQDFGFAVIYDKTVLGATYAPISVQYNSQAGYASGWSLQDVTDGSLTFYKSTTSGGSQTATTSTAIFGMEKLFVVGSKIGTSLKIWVNGTLITDNTLASATVNYTTSTTKATSIGARNSDTGTPGFGLNLVGHYYDGAIFPGGLTPIQAQDLTIDMMKKINNI